MKRLIWIWVILLAGCSLKNGDDANGRAEVTLAPLSAVTETVTPTQQTAAVTRTNTPPPPTAPPNNTKTTACTPRTDWPQTYTVQNGDTLAGIAQKVSSTVNDLASGNCIANPGQIQVG